MKPAFRQRSSVVEQLTRNEQVAGSSPAVGSQENALNGADKDDLGAFLFEPYLEPSKPCPNAFWRVNVGAVEQISHLNLQFRHQSG